MYFILGGNMIPGIIFWFAGSRARVFLRNGKLTRGRAMWFWQGVAQGSGGLKEGKTTYRTKETTKNWERMENLNPVES